MLNQRDTRNGVDKLANELARSGDPSAGLFAAMVAASPRLINLRTAGKMARLEQLVACEAWTDAALELAALEAPGWSVQRLCLDDGEWFCGLTRFPDVPDWLDDGAQGRHRSPALAILSALLEIRADATAAAPVLTRQLAGIGVDCTDYR